MKSKNKKKIVTIVKLPSVSVVPSVLEQKTEAILEETEIGKRAIRRSGLEIRKAEELEEKKKVDYLNGTIFFCDKEIDFNNKPILNFILINPNKL